MSYFTPAEKLRLSFHSFPPCDAPIGYMDVSRTQLSIARHDGGCTVQGMHYVYFPEHDELWRDDVLALVRGWRRTDAMAKELPTAKGWKQTSMLDALADAQTDAKESERLSIIADELIAGFGEPGRALAEMIRQGVTALESHAAHLLRDVRAHTLEEAARVCNPANLIDCPGTYESAAIRKCAAAIRAMKPD